jgi:hypothetical protein
MLLPFVLFATSLACPDLSGRYLVTHGDGNVNLIIEQTGCTRAAIQWIIQADADLPIVRHSLQLDGQFQSDRAWLGSSGRQLTSAAFRGDTLVLLSRAATDIGEPPAFKRVSFRPTAGGICTTFIFGPSHEETSFAWRVRPGQRYPSEKEAVDGKARCASTKEGE